ncbi:hypothetical protein AC482_04740 [miscellaneous Crenarchaeota group-15 archaeon DG-45]|uniref:Uncharacterized protein n=1 Tax=miscellaneous Crenarchaeota group-15 archaeon DG-45 TaxID=1685127 RepID=A0A0M0BNG1_9ARCH|nr:MAG: hypothetical protein AC482_04740 [miscellaneous Crenarchaeota group-15 archaeon DG-45]
MGRVGKGARCSVEGCGDEAVRSISVPKAKAAGLKVDGRRAFLCREHYKEYKKGSKGERRIERWRHGVP